MNKKMSGFQPLYEGHIDELRATGYYYRHETTGAELFFIDAKDDNKVFSVGFSTVPTDDTGVAHITEHCVLCGSEKYPLKELFMTLNKSSLNTYLNAMTFPDKTLYPVASRNDQDFMNLIDVYLDSVFHPTMYRDELFFRQEGHGYEFEQGEDGVPSGVVYNEMKGAMASPDSMLSSKADQALFDNTYSKNSGGEPSAVLDLRYEDFLAFHRKHYHPSNARFYLYGNADIEKICAFLDRCISPFGRGEAVPEPEHAPYHGEPQYVTDYYPTAEETAVATLNFVIGSSYELETVFSAEILTYYLFNQSSSPFKKALTETGFCSDMYGGVDSTRASATVYLTFYGLREFDPRRIEQRVFEELQKIDADELTKSLRAALHFIGFNLREQDTGSNPRGMLPMYQLLLHTQESADPFYRLRYEHYLGTTEERIAKGEHLQWMVKFMLNNSHRVTVVLKPQSEADAAEGDANAQRDLQRWDALTEEQKKQERAWYEKLRAQQEAPDPEEALAALPRVTLADVPRTMEYRDVVADRICASPQSCPSAPSCEYLFYKLDTGIMYVKLFFPVRFGTKEDLSLFSTALNMLGNTATERYSLSELGYEILNNAGGIKCGLETYKNRCYLYVMLKTLPEKLEYNLELIREILLHTERDAKRFSEILSQTYSRVQLDIISSGNRYAAEEILAGFDVEERNNYYSSGLGYFEWLKQAQSADAEALTVRAAELIGNAVRRDGLVIALGGDAHSSDVLRKAMPSFVQALPAGAETEENAWSEGGDLLRERSSAFIIPADIQFVGLGGMKGELGGSFLVLKSLLGTEYLWPEVRMKGGAYGAGMTVSREGHVVFTSYRDPNLMRTLEAFRAAPDFAAKHPEFLETAVLSAVAGFDQPMSPRKEALDAFDRYFLGVGSDRLQRERLEILETTADDLVKASEAVRSILQEGRCCVVGSKKEIEASKEAFDRIVRL